MEQRQNWATGCRTWLSCECPSLSSSFLVSWTAGETSLCSASRAESCNAGTTCALLNSTMNIAVRYRK